MPNLFKITKNGKVSHIYATCHIQNDEVCTLSEEAKQAFEQASYVVVEMTVEEQAKFNEYLPGKIDEWKIHALQGLQTQLTDYLSITQLKKIAELFDSELAQAHPSHLTLFNIIETSPIHLCQTILTQQLKNLGLLGNDPLDNQIDRQAKQVRKPTASLDTAEDMAKRCPGLSFTYQEQIDYAKYFLDKQLSSEELKEMIMKTVTTYLAGDPEELKKIHDSSEVAPICKSYEKSLVDDRDPDLVKAMHPYLEAGNAFIPIGALHLPGVLALLQERGCIIEPIQEGNRLYKVNTLENTNKSLRKANFLADYQFSVECSKRGKESQWISSLFASETTAKLNHRQDLPIFLELMREGKIDRNHKIKIEISDQYNDEELLVLKNILQEPNTPKNIELNLMKNISDENIAFISEIFRSKCSIEELKINLGYANKLGERSLECMTEALKTKMFTGKLHLVMANSDSVQHKALSQFCRF